MLTVVNKIDYALQIGFSISRFNFINRFISYQIIIIVGSSNAVCEQLR